MRKIVSDALASSPVWGGGPPFSIKVSGQHPDNPPSNADCELCLYLFHIATDKFTANSFWSQAAQGGGGVGRQPIAFEPLCLDLWYVMSAQSKTGYVQEQQVLSVAMQALHEHATVQLADPPPPPFPGNRTELTIVLESPTFDEMSRLWQAFSKPLRTTAQYRVSVAFLSPDRVPAGAPKVASYTLTSAPAALGGPADLPLLLSTRRTLQYTGPGPSTELVSLSPAITAPAPNGVGGQEVVLDALRLADTDQLLLVERPLVGPPVITDVTATWKVAQPIPYPAPGPTGGVPFTVRVPDGQAAPPPGRYELAVARPSVPGWRSIGVPLMIAPWIDPAGGPLLSAGGGVYSLATRNVPVSGAALRLGTVELTRVASGVVPAAGEWECNSAGTAITFAAPLDTPSGQHQIGLRAGEVEADPARWAVV
jgi:hypothetical protein